MAEQSLTAIDMMDFDGKQKVKDKVQQGQTLMNMVQQMAQQIQEMQMVLGLAAGMPPEEEAAPASQDDGKHEVHTGGNHSVASKMLADQSGNAMTNYQRQLQLNARADVSGGMVGGGV